jgi:dTDP-4-amino-4,6-dideoxygalactose transaminase
MSGVEEELVHKAFQSNYIAPLGPMVDAFEQEFSEYTGIPHCVALSSGTAATHLALRHQLDRRQATGDRPLVLASTLTFIASVSPATFENCDITFIDCDRKTWNMDPKLLAEVLEQCEKNGRLPAAVIPTDLYGQCCDLPRIVRACAAHGVPVVCDSAEAMGARYGVHAEAPAAEHAGSGAWCSVYSFNGNKIITTSGGGMLASHDEELVAHARKLATQAREPFPYYEHAEIGHNYRMSNIIAAIGRGQLRVLDERVRQKRSVFATYRKLLGGLPGIEFMPESECGRGNRWLTVILVDPDTFGATPESIRLALEKHNIEARPVWKPMHLQPVFAHPKQPGPAYRVVNRGVAEDLFARGLCLPSGTALADSDLEEIAAIVRCVWENTGNGRG